MHVLAYSVISTTQLGVCGTVDGLTEGLRTTSVFKPASSDVELM